MRWRWIVCSYMHIPPPFSPSFHWCHSSYIPPKWPTGFLPGENAMDYNFLLHFVKKEIMRGGVWGFVCAENMFAQRRGIVKAIKANLTRCVAKNYYWEMSQNLIDRRDYLMVKIFSFLYLIYISTPFMSVNLVY